MTWYVWALISAVSLAFQLLLMKHLQRTLPIQVYLFYIWLGAALLLLPLLALGAVETSLLVNLPLLLLAGGASWAGNLAYNKAIKLQPNLGYIEALSGIRLAIAFLVSIAYFGAAMTVAKLLSLVVVAIALTIVSQGSNDKLAGEAADGAGGSVSNVHTVPKIGWIAWALLSGVMFGALIVVVRVLSIREVAASTTIVFVLAIAGALYLGSAVKNKMSLNISGKISVLVAAIVFAAIGNLALFLSYGSAPNLAFPEAISNGRIVILYLAAILSREDKVDPKKAVGVLLAFAAIVVLGN